jgi:signal transduction histidine kinase
VLGIRATSLFEDQEGSLWVGTANGLSQISDVKFPLLTTREGLPDNACHAVASAKNGGVWVTTSRGLSYVQDAYVSDFSSESGLSNPYLKRVFEASDGKVYVIDGLKNLLVLSDNKVVATFPNGNWPVALAEDNAGVVVSVAGQLFRVGNSGLAPCGFKKGEPQMYWIYNLLTGHDGSLWVATANGIVRIQNQEFEQWTLPQSGSNGRVNCLCEDDEGTIWAGLPAGIARLKNGKLKSLSPDDGLADNAVFAIVPDALGNLWAQSARGILRFNRDELNRFADGRTSRLAYVVFDGLEAVKTVDTSEIESSGCQSADGRIWFPTPRGLVMIDPANFFTNSSPPPVVIQRIRVNGEERKPAELSSLRPGARELEFDYAALTFIAPQKILFRYQLQGYDHDWVDAGGRRAAFYTNLKPGNYAFRVQACNADGVWSTSAGSCEIALPPRFYETLWFKLVCVAAGLALVAAMYAWRVGHHRARQIKLQTANEALEFRVQARTSDLARANAALRMEIEAHKAAQDSLEAAQKQLVQTSRQAGMAEVATSILHNVGNVLNSVNVSAALMQKSARASKAVGVAKVATLLGENENDLAAFLQSEKGKQLIAYLDGLGKQLTAEQTQLLAELTGLARNIDHIKQVVAMQQSYARVSGVLEQVDAKELVEDALRMQKESFDRRGIQIIRDFDELPQLELDRHKVLSILVNLLTNAKHACDSAGVHGKIVISIRLTESSRLKIQVQDNGVGISSENLTRIFSHGFTTRKDGHGFGLHSGAVAAQEMSGTLSVHSDGPGKGATFTLELPVKFPATAVQSPAPEAVEPEPALS